MTDFKYILFDLDGTLIDSGEGIINSVKYALKKYGIEENDMEFLKSFIGPPLKQRFKQCYNFTEVECKQLVDSFKEYYVDKGIFENKAYPDVLNVLKELKNTGKHMMVATSKPEQLAHEILAQHDFIKYFDFIGGSLMDETRSNKTEVLQYVLEANHIENENPDKFLMVGDTKYDILGAKKLNFNTLGVTYGYGTKMELLTAGADFIVEEPKEILVSIK